MTKRVSCSCCVDGAAKRAAAMVSLNVGGRRFDTTKETLSRASYFLPYLEGQLSILPTKYLHHHHHPLQGRLDHAADEESMGDTARPEICPFIIYARTHLSLDLLPLKLDVAVSSKLHGLMQRRCLSKTDWSRSLYWQSCVHAVKPQLVSGDLSKNTL